MKEFSFEKLDVWKDAKDFVVKIYQLTEVYPNDEKFGLISQIRRASLSVTNNILKELLDGQVKRRLDLLK